MLDLEKLLEHTEVAVKISEQVIDDGQTYNTVTKSINESVSVNTETDINKVISNGNKINDKLDLDLLESQINGALGLDKKEKPMKNAADVANVPHDAGKPAVGVDDAKKFQDAVAVKQSDFVNANTEHDVSETADDASVTNNADKAMDIMRDGATKEKKEGLKDGGQNVPKDVIPSTKVVTESQTPEVVDEDSEGKNKMQSGAKKAISASDVSKPNDEWKKGATVFKTFVTSLKTDTNTKHMDAVLEAFDVIFHK